MHFVDKLRWHALHSTFCYFPLADDENRFEMMHEVAIFGKRLSSVLFFGRCGNWFLLFLNFDSWKEKMVAQHFSRLHRHYGENREFSIPNWFPKKNPLTQWKGALLTSLVVLEFQRKYSSNSSSLWLQARLDVSWFRWSLPMAWLQGVPTKGFLLLNNLPNEDSRFQVSTQALIELEFHIRIKFLAALTFSEKTRWQVV